jgi:hypothetical protein
MARPPGPSGPSGPQVCYRICVNDMAVPFVVRTSLFRDINGLSIGDSDGGEFLMVCLKAIGDVTWLMKYLDLPVRWWAINAGPSTVPLMCEIIEAIKVNKITKGRGCRFERQQHSIIAIRIRGRVIFVLNNVRDLNIAWKAGDEISGLKWLLLEFEADFARRHEWENRGTAGSSADRRKRSRTEEELSDDSDADPEVLDEFPLEPPPPPPSSSKQQRHYLGHHEHQVVQSSITSLEEHAACKKAKFVPSRTSFMVTKQYIVSGLTMESKEFVVSGLSKHRKKALINHGLGPHEDDDLPILVPMFERTMAKALAFLQRIEDLG